MQRATRNIGGKRNAAQLGRRVMTEQSLPRHEGKVGATQRPDAAWRDRDADSVEGA